MLAGDPDLTGIAPAQDVLDAGGALAALGLVGCLEGPQSLDGLVEVGRDVGEEVGDRTGVGGEDVDPHARVGGRDPGHVPDALPAQPYGRLLGVLQPCGDQAGHEVRHVRDEGDGPVVGVRVHDHRDGPAVRDQLQREVQDLGVGVPGRGEYPGPALEEVTGGGQRPGLLAARHGVAADVGGEVRPSSSSSRRGPPLTEATSR